MVVGLEDEVAARVEVVVDGRRRAVVVAGVDGVVEVGEVEDERARRRRAGLVALVVEEEVALVFGEPALMRVLDVRVDGAAEHDGRREVGGVEDRDEGLVGADADRGALVVRVRARVDHALAVVGAAVGHASGERRSERVRHVDEVEAASARVGQHPGDEAALGQRDDVVGVAEALVERVRVEHDRRARDVAQPCQVEHLDAVAEAAEQADLAHDVRVVAHRLDVAPGVAGALCARVEPAHHDGRRRLGHVDEGGAARAPDEGVLPPGLGVRPAPDVVASPAGVAEVGDSYQGLEGDAVAFEGSRPAVDARGLSMCGGGDGDRGCTTEKA